MSEQPPKLPAPIPADAKRGEGDSGAQQRDDKGQFKEFQPDDKQRELVKGFSAVGLPQAQIATYLGIDKMTLLKHFRRELDTGMIEANTQIAKTLYQQALKGNTAAMIFWSKVRMGWSERIVHANDPDNPMPSGATVNLTLTPEQLKEEAEKRGLPTTIFDK